MKKIIILSFFILFLVSCSITGKMTNINSELTKKENLEVKSNIIKKEKNDIDNTIYITQYSKNYPVIEKLFNDGKIKEAKKILEKEDKNNAGTLKLYYRLYFEQKEYKKALNYGIQANKAFEGTNEEILYLIGIAYDNLGAKVQAKKYIEKSLEINPNYNLAKKYLKILNNHIIKQNDGKK